MLSHRQAETQTLTAKMCGFHRKLCPLCHRRQTQTQKLRETDSCDGCDITDRQRQTLRETAVLVVSQTDRDTETHRKRQLC